MMSCMEASKASTRPDICVTVKEEEERLTGDLPRAQMGTGYGRTAVENLAGHVVELLVELF